MERSGCAGQAEYRFVRYVRSVQVLPPHPLARFRPWWLACAACVLLGVLALPSLTKGLLARDILLGLARGDESPAKAHTDSSRHVLEWDVGLPLSGQSSRGRFYAADDSLDGPQLIVAHGVHHLGIDEPRLVKFSRELAKVGIVVFTPEIADLTEYRITERSIAQLTDAAHYIIGLAPPGREDRVGLIGFSFAGGLSLLAARDRELSEHLRFVASIGGHHDLSRVLRFFMDNEIETPTGTEALRSHEYGLVVLTYECLHDLLPKSDIPLASRVVQAWLQEDRPRALSLMAEASSPESEELFSWLEQGELKRLEPRLRRVLERRQAHLDRLSPSGKLAALGTPAYLLHGSGDTVIPPSETAWADLELAHQEHAALVTPLVRHVALNGDNDWIEQLRLVSFMARLL